MAQITITWKAFGDRPEANRYISSATIELDGVWNQISDQLLLDTFYKVTNLQSDLKEFGAQALEIKLWETISAVLPANRTHTSLSVGDEILINRANASTTHRIANTGWEMVA